MVVVVVDHGHRRCGFGAVERVAVRPWLRLRREERVGGRGVGECFSGGSGGRRGGVFLGEGFEVLRGGVTRGAGEGSED